MASTIKRKGCRRAYSYDHSHSMRTMADHGRARLGGRIDGPRTEAAEVKDMVGKRQGSREGEEEFLTDGKVSSFAC